MYTAAAPRNCKVTDHWGVGDARQLDALDTIRFFRQLDFIIYTAGSADGGVQVRGSAAMIRMAVQC